MDKIKLVLNLIITGIPSIPNICCQYIRAFTVLNLIITGIPSIQNNCTGIHLAGFRFKPYYNWNTFNTLDLNKNIDFMVDWFTF